METFSHLLEEKGAILNRARKLIVGGTPKISPILRVYERKMKGKSMDMSTIAYRILEPESPV
jgi:hypothetical protein